MLTSAESSWKTHSWIMLMLVIFIISVISSSARTIENDTSESLDLFESTNETSSELQREKRQVLGFNTDFSDFFGRAADNFNRIRSVVQNGLALGTSITNMINSTTSSNQPRTIQDAIQVVGNGLRNMMLGYFRRMGIIQ
ncbi:hypothetical protein AVEN_269605-1 [Araneus ventricosus]|uniref:Uncharacterized protein n=1 Tax=Araneus ventricosus TaxID=182803 RepID=A0A4Y2CFB2_ARAVE|nr:hypothetical protein AVEN_269605-1 [Araneus ventricosus]